MERLESTSVGRAVVSALAIVIVASIVMSSLSDGPLRRSLLRNDQALLDVTGLDQRWNLFAPDPRRRVIEVRARIRYASGREETWRLPRGAPVVGAYWDHRWRKWMDNASTAGARSPLWQSLARWLAAKHGEDGERPVSVTVVGRWSDLRPPGARGPDRGPWRQVLLFRHGRT